MLNILEPLSEPQETPQVKSSSDEEALCIDYLLQNIRATFR